jgi:cellulose synthase/poly-beta-1,6-N-acetylglucosamine synthase-like glycosyltransferase
LTQVRLSAASDEPLRAQPTGYVAIEDANIVAQVPLIKGLEKWCDSERLNPTQPEDRYCNGAVAAWDWPVVSRSVDIVICVHDAIEETLACLDSVRQFTQMPHTVTIVDDASSEFTREQLRRYCAGLPWIRHVQLKQNMGYTKAANIGLKQSKADWLVLLNSDTVVSPGWLE